MTGRQRVELVTRALGYTDEIDPELAGNWVSSHIRRYTKDGRWIAVDYNTGGMVMKARTFTGWRIGAGAAHKAERVIAFLNGEDRP